MPKISKKLAARKKVYSMLRKDFLEAHPWCQWWLAEHGLQESDVVNGMVEWNRGFNQVWIPVPRSTQIHHKNKRFGSRLNETKDWMAVSDEGHKWIEEHKDLARERGYLNNI